MSEWSILAFLALIAASAFFSGSEIALVSASRARLEALAHGGRRDASRALQLLADTPGTLACLLVGNNLVNVAASSLATAIAVGLSEHGVALATAVMTPVLLFVGEIVPKALSRSRPSRFLRVAAPGLLAARGILAPAVWLTTTAVRGVLALLRVPAAVDRPVLRRDELENAFLYGSPGEQGAPGPERDWFRMAGRALELGRRRTAEAMVRLLPERTCPAAGTVGDALERFRAGGSRYLAATDTQGGVAGFVAAKSLLGEDPAQPIARYIRPAHVLSPDEPLDRAIQGFRRHQQSIALVRDAEGRSLGVVTTEDLLEEIVGELPRMGRLPARPPGASN